MLQRMLATACASRGTTDVLHCLRSSAVHSGIGGCAKGNIQRYAVLHFLIPTLVLVSFTLALENTSTSHTTTWDCSNKGGGYY